MTVCINSDYGIIISRELFNNMIVENKKRWHTKEKLPPCSASLKVAKTLSHYCAPHGNAREYVAIARGHKNLFDFSSENISFEKIDRFPKNQINIDDFLATHQKVCIKKIIECYNKNNWGDILLAMGTGLGKTRLACFLINKIGIKTIIIVPTKHIAQQWKEELETMFNANNFITMYVNKLGSQSKEMITICIINTARNKKSSFFKQFGLVIFDEVHEYTTNKSKNILWYTSGIRFRLGLTATPEYTGFGLLPYLEGHLGSTLYADTIPNFAISIKNFNVTVHAIKFYASEPKYATPILSSKGTVSIMETLGRILEDPDRTELVVDIINDLYVKGKNILIFAEFRNYLDCLSVLLGEKHNIVLKGGVDYKILCEASTARIILTTYAYSRRGINYDQLDTLVLATPRKNGLKQIIGRILRYKSDNTIPRIIVDIIDYTSVLKGQFYERQKIYKNRNYQLIVQ